MMNDENEKKTLELAEKGPYEAPKVIRVSLRPEEAVLGHCKVTGAMGPVSASGCKGALGVCRTFGS
jgi:hypothetical protein